MPTQTTTGPMAITPLGRRQSLKTNGHRRAIKATAPALNSKLSCLLALLLFIACLPRAFAQSDPCGNQTSTAAIRSCETARYNKATQELQTLLATLTNQKDAIGKRKLETAQAAWLRYRDASADFEADAARGGALAPVLRLTTLATMTQQRAADLAKDIKEGQLTK
jgi:uncharacterized protein YecT (DUF1311 family)